MSKDVKDFSIYRKGWLIIRLVTVYRSSRFNLRRVIGEASLTSEEYRTVLCQIEAIFDSHSLNPLSSDPTDLNPLTLGHFSIDRLWISIPDQDVSALPVAKLSKFQHHQHFWKR